MRRFHALVSILAGGALAAAAAGCSRPADSRALPKAVTEPVFGGTVNVMVESPGTLDPRDVDDVYEAAIVNQIYDGLLEFDTNLNPVPAIAREWTISDGGRRFRFRLRDDVSFHNGRRVVASDVVWSFERIFDPDREDPGLGGEFLRRIEGADAYARGKTVHIEGLEAVDDTTLVIRLAEPYGAFLSSLAMDQTKVVCREAFEAAGDDYDSCPVGTGPFRFDHVADHDDHPVIVLRRNVDYFRGAPWLAEVAFHVPARYTDDRAADALLDGTLTLAVVTGPREEAFENLEAFRILRRPELSCGFLALNPSLAPVDDARVRRAIAHAVDRRRFVALDPASRLDASGILPPGMFGHSPDPKALRHDPDVARSLLAEAGYPGGEGLVPLRIVQVNRGDVGAEADRILAENLAEIGIRVEYEYLDWGAFSDRIDAGTAPAYTLSWIADVPDPDSFLRSLFSTDGAYNLVGYHNATVDSLLAVGSGMTSSPDRARLYQRAERIILNDAPIVPLYHLANNFVVRSNVRGLTITPFGFGNLTFEKLWLDPVTS
ncbi:MAG: ABC transporter substrate-binding protein [bacterium]